MHKLKGRTMMCNRTASNRTMDGMLNVTTQKVSTSVIDASSNLRFVKPPRTSNVTPNSGTNDILDSSSSEWLDKEIPPSVRPAKDTSESTQSMISNEVTPQRPQSVASEKHTLYKTPNLWTDKDTSDRSSSVEPGKDTSHRTPSRRLRQYNVTSHRPLSFNSDKETSHGSPSVMLDKATSDRLPNARTDKATSDRPLSVVFVKEKPHSEASLMSDKATTQRPRYVRLDTVRSMRPPCVTSEKETPCTPPCQRPYKDTTDRSSSVKPEKETSRNLPRRWVIHKSGTSDKSDKETHGSPYVMLDKARSVRRTDRSLNARTDKDSYNRPLNVKFVKETPHSEFRMSDKLAPHGPPCGGPDNKSPHKQANIGPEKAIPDRPLSVMPEETLIVPRECVRVEGVEQKIQHRACERRDRSPSLTPDRHLNMTAPRERVVRSITITPDRESSLGNDGMASPESQRVPGKRLVSSLFEADASPANEDMCRATVTTHPPTYSQRACTKSAGSSPDQSWLSSFRNVEDLYANPVAGPSGLQDLCAVEEGSPPSRIEGVERVERVAQEEEAVQSRPSVARPRGRAASPVSVSSPEPSNSPIELPMDLIEKTFPWVEKLKTSQAYCELQKHMSLKAINDSMELFIRFATISVLISSKCPRRSTALNKVIVNFMDEFHAALKNFRTQENNGILIKVVNIVSFYLDGLACISRNHMLYSCNLALNAFNKFLEGDHRLALLAVLKSKQLTYAHYPFWNYIFRKCLLRSTKDYSATAGTINIMAFNVWHNMARSKAVKKNIKSMAIAGIQLPTDFVARCESSKIIPRVLPKVPLTTINKVSFYMEARCDYREKIKVFFSLAILPNFSLKMDDCCTLRCKPIKNSPLVFEESPNEDPEDILDLTLDEKSQDRSPSEDSEVPSDINVVPEKGNVDTFGKSVVSVSIKEAIQTDAITAELDNNRSDSNDSIKANGLQMDVHGCQSEHSSDKDETLVQTPEVIPTSFIGKSTSLRNSVQLFHKGTLISRLLNASSVTMKSNEDLALLVNNNKQRDTSIKTTSDFNDEPVIIDWNELCDTSLPRNVNAELDLINDYIFNECSHLDGSDCQSNPASASTKPLDNNSFYSVSAATVDNQAIINSKKYVPKIFVRPIESLQNKKKNNIDPDSCEKNRELGSSVFTLFSPEKSQDSNVCDTKVIEKSPNSKLIEQSEHSSSSNISRPQATETPDQKISYKPNCSPKPQYFTDNAQHLLSSSNIEIFQESTQPLEYESQMGSHPSKTSFQNVQIPQNDSLVATNRKNTTSSIESHLKGLFVSQPSRSSDEEPQNLILPKKVNTPSYYQICGPASNKTRSTNSFESNLQKTSPAFIDESMISSSEALSSRQTQQATPYPSLIITRSSLKDPCAQYDSQRQRGDQPFSDDFNMCYDNISEIPVFRQGQQVVPSKSSIPKNSFMGCHAKYNYQSNISPVRQRKSRPLLDESSLLYKNVKEAAVSRQGQQVATFPTLLSMTGNPFMGNHPQHNEIQTNISLLSPLRTRRPFLDESMISHDNDIEAAVFRRDQQVVPNLSLAPMTPSPLLNYSLQDNDLQSSISSLKSFRTFGSKRSYNSSFNDYTYSEDPIIGSVSSIPSNQDTNYNISMADGCVRPALPVKLTGYNSSNIEDFLKEVLFKGLFRLHFLPNNDFDIEVSQVNVNQSRVHYQVTYDSAVIGRLHVRVYDNAFYVNDGVLYINELKTKYANEYFTFSNKINGMIEHASSSWKTAKSAKHSVTLMRDFKTYANQKEVLEEISNDHLSNKIDKLIGEMSSFLHDTKRSRCACLKCSANHVVILSNYNLLQKLHILHIIHECLLIHYPQNGLECDRNKRDSATLPLKKRCRTPTSIPDQGTSSYPATRMMSIADLYSGNPCMQRSMQVAPSQGSGVQSQVSSSQRNHNSPPKHSSNSLVPASRNSRSPKLVQHQLDIKAFLYPQLQNYYVL